MCLQKVEIGEEKKNPTKEAVEVRTWARLQKCLFQTQQFIKIGRHVIYLINVTVYDLIRAFCLCLVCLFSFNNMDAQDFRNLALSPRALGSSNRGWFEIPEETWEAMKSGVQTHFSMEAMYLWMEAIYLAIAQEEKFHRPPKGVVIKHLCVWVLHLISSGNAFAVYSFEGELPLGFSKSFFRKGLDYILQRSTVFVQTHLQPRPVDEMAILAKEFYSSLGMKIR